MQRSTRTRFLDFMRAEDAGARIVKAQGDLCVFEFSRDPKKVPRVLRHFKLGLEKFLVESWSLSQTNLKDVFKRVVLG